MLQLISDRERKLEIEEQLQSKIKAVLTPEGSKRINARKPEQIYSAGASKLWVAFAERKDVRVPRFENFCGIFEPDEPAQTITVEINIAIGDGDNHIHGCFAENTETGEICLMRDGIFFTPKEYLSRPTFDDWSKMNRFSMSHTRRPHYLVSKLNDLGLVENLWSFVREVARYKIMRSQELG